MVSWPDLNEVPCLTQLGERVLCGSFLGFWLDPNYLGVREKFPTASLEAEGAAVTSLSQATWVLEEHYSSLILSKPKSELSSLICEDWPV